MSPSSMFLGIAYFSLVLIELAVVAVFARLAQDIIKSSSLNDRDTVDRVWSRAREISLQPVALPLLFACAVHYGVDNLMCTVLALFLNLMGPNDFVPFGGGGGGGGSGGGDDLVTNFEIIWLNAEAFIAVVVYRVSGGVHTKTLLAATAAISAFHFENQVERSVLYAIIQLPMHLWLAYHQLPLTASSLPSSPDLPQSSGFRHSMLRTAGPLMALHFIQKLIGQYQTTSIFFSRIASSLQVLVLGGACALASLASIKRALLAGHYQWQWRAFLTPAVPIFCYELGLILFSALPDKTYPTVSPRSLIYCTIVSGTSGVLGVYSYLKFVENAAATHLARRASAS